MSKIIWFIKERNNAKKLAEIKPYAIYHDMVHYFSENKKPRTVFLDGSNVFTKSFLKQPFTEQIFRHTEYTQQNPQTMVLWHGIIYKALFDMYMKYTNASFDSYYLSKEQFEHKSDSQKISIADYKKLPRKYRQLFTINKYTNTYVLNNYENDMQLKSSVGEILFTEYGVSGNAVFQVSSAVAGVKNAWLNVEFLPELTTEEIIEILKTRAKMGGFEGENYLCGILNKRIGQAVMKTVKNPSVSSVAYALKNFRLNVTGDLGFNYSQVTKGGIETIKVNPYTFESKLIKNFHIVGEALDVDGDCGGYNLTFAFVSGIVSARAIKQKITK